MALLDYFEKIKRIDQFVRMQATGTPEEFAQRLGIAKSTLYSYINVMKELDIPIQYNNERRTFYYTQVGKLKIGYTTSELTDYELKNTNAGFYLQNISFFMVGLFAVR